jgi:DNA-binding beta-propeller fold protein YncE
MNRGPGTISVIDPDSDAIIETLKADRGSLTALNPVTNRLYVSASTGTDPSVIDLATKSSTTIHAGTEGNALSVNVNRRTLRLAGSVYTLNQDCRTGACPRTAGCSDEKHRNR